VDERSENGERSEIDLAVIDELLTTTRSVRLRLDLERPVDLALVDECLTIALQAPNGSGRELWRFVVVADPAQRARIGELYHRSSMAYLEHLRREHPDLDETSRAFRSSQRLWNHLGDVPVLVVPCIEREPWHLTSPQRGYVDASVYGTIFPATWSFQLACRSRGLGTCFVTSLLKHEDELRDVLGLPAEFAIGGLVAVAHTTGSFAPARRRPLADVRRFDRWSDADDQSS
jgi:nitroreductase